ncbi:MAG: hypothetical protein GY794_11555, partial [bacterium]|nr:hypothetical protein [bacterium]
MTELPNPDTTQDSAVDDTSLIVRFMVRYRLMTQLVIHAVLFTLALLMAFLIRYEAAAAAVSLDTPTVEWAWRFWRCLPFFLIVKLLIFGKMKLFRGGWRYASIRDVTNILLASWWFVFIGFVMWMLFSYAPQ